MEYYQLVQNRAMQTAAVIAAHIPDLKAGTATSATLLTLSAGLDTAAEGRDARLADYDSAVNAEFAGYSLLRKLDVNLPAMIDGELDDDLPAEADLLGKLDPVYAIAPDTTEDALKRARKLKVALALVDDYLAERTPPRGPLTSGGRGAAALAAAIAAQPALEEAVEVAAVDVADERSNLRTQARTLDRLNKRFYQKLVAEARDNPALADALGQIATENASQPATLGIRKILQGGAGGLQLLVSYDGASYDDALENTPEWLVVGVDADFTHTLPAAPSGNEIGPFTVGQQVKLRTRTRNASGTTTGSVRTLTLLAVA